MTGSIHDALPTHWRIKGTPEAACGVRLGVGMIEADEACPEVVTCEGCLSAVRRTRLRVIE